MLRLHSDLGSFQAQRTIHTRTGVPKHTNQACLCGEGRGGGRRGPKPNNTPTVGDKTKLQSLDETLHH